MRIGGSKDIQTDIYTSDSEEVVGDAYNNLNQKGVVAPMRPLQPVGKVQ